MQKKFLAVLLALCLVLAFSSLAMAAEQETTADFTVALDTPNPNTANFDPIAVENYASDGTLISIDYDVYSKSNTVDLIFTPKEGVTLTSVTEVDGEDNKFKATLTDDAVVTVTATKTGADEQPVTTTYKFSLINLNNYTTTIASDLYNGENTNATAYSKSGTSILVPTKLSKVYGKITVTDGTEQAATEVNYTVTVNGKKTIVDLTDNNNAYFEIPIDDFTEDINVTVTMGGFEIKNASFNLLRPTLKSVKFNDEAKDLYDQLNIKTNLYEYNTKELVDSDWSTVYIKPEALAGSKADVSVKRVGLTGNTELNKSGSWWYQRMVYDVYELLVTVTVGSGSDAIKEYYTIYLMGDEYEGPTVKTFKANEKSTGRGDDYLTVVDEQNKTIYVFLPDGEDEFYAYVTMNGDIKDDMLKLDYTFKEGLWSTKAIDTGTKELTYKDEVGLKYTYTVKVTEGNKKYNDASLKSLTVKNGSKQSTASEVDIDFDPDVTEYAFPVSDRDVWLSIAAKANDSHATVFINEKQTTSITETKLDTDAVTEYEILVVAGDGVTTETYTVTVNGSTGLLQTLSASNTIGLTPAFDPDVNTYTAYTNAGTASTYIYAIAKNYSSDYVQISKANFNAYGQVSSYTALTKVAKGGTNVTAELKSGSNIFRVDVLASEKATSAKASYYLSIYVPTASPKCVVSSQKLYVNGKEQTLSAYNIAGNNYLKLRDIAALLDGTTKEMKVDWDQTKWTASMAMPGTFTKRGDELTTLTAPTKYAISTQFFTYNAAPVFPLAYNVTGSGDSTGSNYVMLRDVASLLDFGVTYNATSKAININTTTDYTPGL